MAMHRLAREAVTDAGRYVMGAEYFSLLHKLARLPKAGRYRPGGIFLHYLDARDLRREVYASFDRVGIHYKKVALPWVRKLDHRVARALCRGAESLWPLRELAELVFIQAERPARDPHEATAAPAVGSVGELCRWYLRRMGRS